MTTNVKAGMFRASSLSATELLVDAAQSVSADAKVILVTLSQEGDETLVGMGWSQGMQRVDVLGALECAKHDFMERYDNR